MLAQGMGPRVMELLALILEDWWSPISEAQMVQLASEDCEAPWRELPLMA